MENPGKNVRAKAGLNREMLAAGLGGLRVMIAYKVEERGGKIEPVDPKNTSRTCPKCGMVAAENRRREAFKCVACGYEADADINAAVNILERGLSSSARGGGGVTRPCEARIIPTIRRLETVGFRSTEIPRVNNPMNCTATFPPSFGQPRFRG